MSRPRFAGYRELVWPISRRIAVRSDTVGRTKHNCTTLDINQCLYQGRATGEFLGRRVAYYFEIVAETILAASVIIMPSTSRSPSCTLWASPEAKFVLNLTTQIQIKRTENYATFLKEILASRSAAR